MFLEAIYESLDCSDNDEEALFAICLLYAAIGNKGRYGVRVTLRHRVRSRQYVTDKASCHVRHDTISFS